MKDTLSIEQMIPLLVSGAAWFAENHDNLKMACLYIRKGDYDRYPTFRVGTGEKLLLLQLARRFVNTIPINERRYTDTIYYVWGPIMLLKHFYPSYIPQYATKKQYAG